MSDWPRDLPAAAHQASLRVLGELKGVQSTADQNGTENVSPVVLFVRDLAKLEGKTFFVASEVADQLNISVQAVRKYAKNKVCGDGVAPSYKARFGRKVTETGEDAGIEINLYTPEDVEALRTFLKGRQVVYKT